DRLYRCGDEIVAAGQFFHTGTPVVLWIDPQGYDAYRCRRHFEPSEIMPRNPSAPDDPNRYNIRRILDEDLKDRIDKQGWTLENLQSVVDQFVIHYDVCGTSCRCFEILQDIRGLSVHFMLDVDGTIYQTLDLKERAWHAGTANDRSVGIEIAHIGAYPDMETLNEWYALDDGGWPYITFPDWMTETGIRTPGFVGRAAHKKIIKGTINGRELMQYDFTNEQYDALTKLTAALARIFPQLKLDVPRDTQGNLRRDVLSRDELEAYSGLLAHWHITKAKIDPGPAFDWDRVLGGAR
ncbi:MAG: N-acetylmuramoyl-L-alanine amidase, partial [Planctomycetota bacterium]